MCESDSTALFTIVQASFLLTDASLERGVLSRTADHLNSNNTTESRRAVVVCRCHLLVFLLVSQPELQRPVRPLQLEHSLVNKL